MTTPETKLPRPATDLSAAAKNRTPVPQEVRLTLAVDTNDHATNVCIGSILRNTVGPGYYIQGAGLKTIATISEHDGVHEIHGHGFSATFTIAGVQDFGTRDTLHHGEFVIVDIERGEIIFHASPDTVAAYPAELYTRQRELEIAHAAPA